MSGTSLSADGLRDLSRRAAFIFHGQVEAVGRSNLEGVEPDERMALVRVDDVIVAPPLLGNLAGQTVTVYLEAGRGAKAKETATFFATSWHYGRTIGVIEIGRTSATAASLRRDVSDERAREHGDRLEQRLTRADLVISGRVLSIFRTDERDLPGRDEGVDWWQAEMRVATVEKGRPPPDLHIVFPEGGDREWGPVPKAHPGQIGIWLLGPVGERDAAVTRTGKPGQEPLMALDPLDYQAISALPLIRALLQRTGK